ncbi:hypothetical protein HP062_11930 [Pseudomonas sp. B14-6]|uniref:hypothetical protein n=1 Tax=Pseudomonas sp. B14-6 TaxID=2738843 RepID=UPI00155EFCE6|nr:hypothetical protein [Pseudomonas sp. B14-6]QKG66230.1 hypothetical protein HP062_11930 [Pseudomonas sp. B14-6]
MNNTRTSLTAPSVKVNLDTLDWKDTGIRLASREDFFPYNGVNVTIADPCLASDNELELLLDDKVIARHIITTADAGSPLMIHVKPEDLTEGRHELSYRVKINNQPFQTCEQRAEIHVALRSLTDLRLEKVTSRHHGPFAQIQISYPHAAPWRRGRTTIYRWSRASTASPSTGMLHGCISFNPRMAASVMSAQWIPVLRQSFTATHLKREAKR